MSEEKTTKKPLTLSRGKLELKHSSGSQNRIGPVVEVRKSKKHVLHPVKVTQTSAEQEAIQSHKIKLIKEAMKLEEQKAKERAQQEALSLKEEKNDTPISQEEDISREFEKEAPVVKEIKVVSTKEIRKKHAMDDDDEEDDIPFRGKRTMEDKNLSKKSKGMEERRRSGKINISSIYTGEDDDDGDVFTQKRSRSLASIRRAREKERLKHAQSLKTAEKIIREVRIPEIITVQDLANRMAEKAATVVKTLMNMGVMATITQTIDGDTAQIVAEELGHKVIRVSESDIENVLKSSQDKEEDKVPRPPVVTVMGHVDHGKTSLLDALRSTNVASGETGGITQHIGAYQIVLETGKKVTFIDTPGHEAFTEMRARGAKITDIVILVVAANDSVMPQTIEAIHHAKAAQVPMIVAVNKIDLPGADPEKVKMDLLNHEVVVESLGGDVLSVDISAKKKQNLDKLIEAILLQAEVLDLKANPNRSAEGVVIESKMEKGRGPVATVLISRGTLHVGDIVVVGQQWGRVRSLQSDQGIQVESARPADPVEVIGLQGVPAAGDDLAVVENEAKAREISGYRQRKAREALAVKRIKGSSMEQILTIIKDGKMKELPVIIKGDVQGSVEALQGTLAKIANEEVRIKILHAAVGSINETDVSLARASQAIIIGFNVRANAQAREIAKRDNVDIRYYSIIYDVAHDMKKAVEGLLTPEEKEKILGYAEVRKVFNISKVGKVAGCMVTEGTIKRGAKVRLLRDHVVIHEGDLVQLKHAKDDLKEAKTGFECGIRIANYDDLKIGDQIECFEIEQIAPTLNIRV